MNEQVANSPEVLESVKQRVARVFAARSVLPFHGIQYRSSECARTRCEPRDVAAFLARAVATHSAVREVHPALYAVTTTDERAIAEKTTRILETLTMLATSDASAVVRSLADGTRRQLGGRVSVLAEDHYAPTCLVGDITVDRYSITLRVRRGRTPALLVWVTHELPWIEPDDPRLWQHVLHADAEGAQLVIVARKVGVPTFALCRALGIRAVQYYAHLVSSDHVLAGERFLAALDQAGWPQVRTVPTPGQHPVFSALERAIATMASPDRFTGAATIESNAAASSFPPPPRVALAVARAVGLDRQSHASPTSLLTWARSAGVRMPRPWLETVERWAGFGATVQVAGGEQPTIEQSGVNVSPAQEPRRAAQKPAAPASAPKPRASVPANEQSHATTVTRITPVAEVDRETWTSSEADSPTAIDPTSSDAPGAASVPTSQESTASTAELVRLSICSPAPPAP